jgi:hypothetical protein
VRVQIINSEAHATLASICYPEHEQFVTEAGVSACRPNYEVMCVDGSVRGSHTRREVHEALHKYTSKAGIKGFVGLERADPLSESLPEHLAWMEDDTQFPPGTRAFADCGYMVTQLV